MSDVARFQALTFDCYGTLIDWEQGILTALRPLRRRLGDRVDDRRLLVAFGEAESRIEREHPTLPYTEILRRVHQSLESTFELPEDAAAAASFAGSVGGWPPFPDTVAALRDLQTRFKLVIVSNTDHASFAGTQRVLGIRFDALVLAEDVGAYKPDRRMFDRALSTLAEMGIGRDSVIHVAQSLYHDHVPAQALGVATAWVDRYRGQSGGAVRPPGIDTHPDYTVGSLRELAVLLGVSTV